MNWSPDRYVLYPGLPFRSRYHSLVRRPRPPGATARMRPVASRDDRASYGAAMCLSQAPQSHREVRALSSAVRLSILLWPASPSPDGPPLNQTTGDRHRGTAPVRVAVNGTVLVWPNASSRPPGSRRAVPVGLLTPCRWRRLHAPPTLSESDQKVVNRRRTSTQALHSPGRRDLTIAGGVLPPRSPGGSTAFSDSQTTSRATWTADVNRTV